MVKEIVGAGTPETTWRPWADLQPWPSLPEPPPGRVTIVAPHPDDEILGLGGLSAQCRPARLVAVTDGEASHPESTVFSQAQLAAIRREETSQALKRLGLPDIDVVHLGQPDGRIDEPDLVGRLSVLLEEGDWCFATWRGDGHPDHEAVGRAAAAACAAVGARLWEYPVWMWHWASPDPAPRRPSERADRSVPWHRAHRIPLTVDAQTRKAEAIAAFESQVAAIGPAPGDAAILPPWVLARFQRPFEVVFG